MCNFPSEKMLDDADSEVRREFIRRCPAERLPEYADRLLSDEEACVRQEFASRCPAERLPEFAGSPARQSGLERTPRVRVPLPAGPACGVRRKTADRC